VVFDLGRGGSFASRPDPGFGRAAYEAAGTAPTPQGVVGAGTGAVAGGLKGGVGSASALLSDGVTVAAVVVVNAAGSTVDPRTGELYGARFGVPGEFPGLLTPTAAEAAAATTTPPPTLATTIGVIATDATLTKAQCAKVAGVGHDGLARAIRPVHSMTDGDTLFTLATGARAASGFHDLLTAAADCVTRAIVHAMLAATTVATPAGTWRAYRDVFPSAFTGRR
jgi:putative pantetheine hydrolase